MFRQMPDYFSTPPGEAVSDTRPDMSHVRNWIFDLDNTLYRADSGVFARIDARMTDFVAALLGTGHDEARVVQKALYRTHGTTLNGLIKVYDIDPDPYLDFVHQIDLSDLHAQPGLVTAMARLPGRRYVFTNGCANHAARILDRVGLTDMIEDIWDIRAGGFVPKPDPLAYERIVAQNGMVAGQTAMFDDIARNLVPAHRLGMTTVWLNTNTQEARMGPEFPIASARHIDHEANDLSAFLNDIRI
jgi:putative hydrolase of the HAD superfamily